MTAEPGTSTILFRADAGVSMGAGHVVRCLALAQGWRDVGGEACFVMARGAEAFCEPLRAEGIQIHTIDATPDSVEDARETIRLAGDHSAAWVVVDGYHLGPGYRRRIAGEGLRLAVLDDNGEQGQYVAGVIINHNLHAAEEMYADRPSGARLLLGPRYTLLRRQFARDGGERAIPAAARKILVALGGGDENNATAAVLKAIGLLGRADLEVRVILGGASPHESVLRAMGEGLPGTLHFERNVSDMAARMAWADLGVTAAGGTCREAACMGLPSVLLVLADNQLRVAEMHAGCGAAVNMGDAAAVAPEAIARAIEKLLDDPARREAMARAGRTLADGRGAARVVSVLRGRLLQVRPAVVDDARLLWNWANEPEVRAVSFHSEPIPWETHLRWFASKLQDEDCRILVTELPGAAPVGVIRFEAGGEEAAVSVSVSKGFRGQGLGAETIRRGTEAFLNETTATCVRAFVKPDNTASLRAFEAAGYQPAGEVSHEGMTARQLIVQRFSQRNSE
jgi:UDP-2,4-diacetamido-2,4,6-trideoxy-beta-L-altropyranose hydrolase